MDQTDTKIVVLGQPSHVSPIPLGGAVDGQGSVFVSNSARVRYTVEIGTQRDAPADILYLEAGNILEKQLSFMANADSAGLVLGAKVSVILAGRADSVRTRLASCAVAMMAVHARRARV